MAVIGAPALRGGMLALLCRAASGPASAAYPGFAMAEAGTVFWAGQHHYTGAPPTYR